MILTSNDPDLVGEPEILPLLLAIVSHAGSPVAVHVIGAVPEALRVTLYDFFRVAFLRVFVVILGATPTKRLRVFVLVP